MKKCGLWLLPFLLLMFCRTSLAIGSGTPQVIKPTVKKNIWKDSAVSLSKWDWKKKEALRKKTEALGELKSRYQACLTNAECKTTLETLKVLIFRDFLNAVRWNQQKNCVQKSPCLNFQNRLKNLLTSASKKKKEQLKILFSTPEVQVRFTSKGRLNASFSPTTQSAIINALAGILIERGKQELVLTFLEKFGDGLCGKDDADKKKQPALYIREILPKTCKIYDSFKSDLLSQADFLVKAIKEDFTNLPTNLVFGLTHQSILLGKTKDSQEGKALISFLKEMLLSFQFNRDYLKTLQILSRNQEEALKVFLHPLCERLSKKNPQKITKCKKALVEVFNKLEKEINTIKNNVENYIAPDSYHAINVFTCSQSSQDNGKCDEKIKAVVSITRSGLSIVFSVLNTARTLLGEGSFSTDRLKKLQNISTEIPSILEKIFKKSYLDAGLQVLSVIPNFLPDGTSETSLTTLLKKYIPFIVKLAQVKDSSEAKKVIESVALPVGSWRLKRKSAFLLSIGGLVGIGYNRNLYCFGCKEAPEKPAGGIAITGLVGLDMSWGAGDWTIGFFLSALDIGEVVNYQLFRPETLNDELVTDFSKVFSPGLFFRVGLGKSPFVIGLGLSVSPLLAKATFNTTTTDPKDPSKSTTEVKIEYNTHYNLRFQAFIAVDIPLLELWSWR